MRTLALIFLLGLSAACSPASEEGPVDGFLPVMRWDHHPDAASWTEASLVALSTHGAPLAEFEPADIETWCPAYTEADPPERWAFWSGFLSALAKYESTWRPEAAGGGGRWIGLLQIAPATARHYGCRATSVEALKDGEANLSCGIRIMSQTVPRDGVIAAKESRWQGVAADWAPIRRDGPRADMAAWTSSQSYCQR